LIGFAYARPSYDRIVAADIRYALANRNMKGIKIHRGETLLHRDIIGPVLEVAIEYDVPCLIDSGDDYPAISGIVEKYPELKLILPHLGSL
jgi:predicted TIM-barrel fold metal-dependent hydrolase